MSSRIHTIQLEDYEEKHAPPDRLLEIALVADCLHLDIVKYNETYETSDVERLATFSVDVNTFRKALALLVRDQREQEEKKDVPFGERSA